MLDLHEELLETALDLHRRGAPIALCRPGCKNPIGDGWQDRRWTVRDIRKMFREHGPGCNLGLRLGRGNRHREFANLVDLECDSARAEHDFARLFHGCDPPVTPCFRARRGKHRLFRASDRLLRAVDSATVKFGCLDILLGANGKGAQSLIPPSRANGVERRWLVDFDQCDPAPLPVLVERRILERFANSRQPDKPLHVGGAQHNGSTPSAESNGSLAHCQQTSLPSLLTSYVTAPLLCHSTILCHESVEEAIFSTVPTGPRQRHPAVFDLVRRLRAMFPDDSVRELEPIVRRWHALAKPKIRTKTFAATWRDFVDGWGRVRFPYGKTLAAFYSAALAQPLPRAAERYDDLRVKNLIALCHALAQHHHPEPFYLTCRAVAQLFGVNRNQANRWLKQLAGDGVLKLDKPGRRGRGSRYRFVADTTDPA